MFWLANAMHFFWENRAMSNAERARARDRGPLARLVVVTAMGCLFLSLAFPAFKAAVGEPQLTFKTPEAAAKALVEACRKDDTKSLERILGADGKELLYSGDEAQDKTSRQVFAQASDEMLKVLKSGPDRMVIQVGKNNWALPIPIVKAGKAWHFDAAAGMDEILDRRIGHDELNAIQVCRAYVQAQREYFSKDHDGDKVLEYAQRIASTPGQTDGLYWPETGEGERSPMGPMAAEAAKEGLTEKTPTGASAPYHGYYYKILTGQGPNAPGGAYSYVLNGNMVAGFALLAYPAQYASTGIVTFLVGPNGIVYEKDLGLKTEEVVTSLNVYDPDTTWKKSD
jgi:hypothetical protein